MYRDEIKIIELDNRKYNRDLLLDGFKIYLTLLFRRKYSKRTKEEFISFLTEYFKENYFESKILQSLKKYYGKYDENEICETVLEDLNTHFFHAFNYNEFILRGYQEGLAMDDPLRMTVLPREYPIIDEEGTRKAIEYLKENSPRRK